MPLENLDTHTRTGQLRIIHHIGAIYPWPCQEQEGELAGIASKAQVPPYKENPSQMGDSGDNMVVRWLAWLGIFRTNAADNPYLYDMNLLSKVTKSFQ